MIGKFLNTYLCRTSGWKLATLKHPAISLSPGVLANSNPILAGAGSVFNLAGIMDEPIVGLMPPGVPIIDESLELLPFYVDRAERILGQAEEIMQDSEDILGATDFAFVSMYGTNGVE
jgi:hypothetical protein